MGRAPCCSKVGLHRGPWTPKEDILLTKYIQAHGEGQWRSLPKRAGLLRCGKSCRLRWMNYLRPDIKRGNISPEEDDLIIRMHSLLGNRWSLIAGRLPGRTDNEIKNYWNTHLSKKLKTTQLGVGSDRHLQTAKKKNNNKKKKKQQQQQQQAKNNNIKSNQKNVEMMMEEEEGEIEEKKTNIYLPKPIRVRALSIHRNDSTTTTTTTLTLDSNINGCCSAASGSSSQDKEESPSELILQKELNYGLWDESDALGFFIDNIDIVNGSISEDNNNNMECLSSLDKLYEEYFQLLKNNNNICEENQGELDSFAQSLFV